MRKIFAMILVFTFCSVFSSAQQKKSAQSDKWDVFAGYSFSRASLVNESPFPLHLNGGMASASYYPTKHLGATAEFAGYTDDVDSVTFNTQGYLFGPSTRFGLGNRFSRVSFFAHQLFGVTHISMKSDTGEDCKEGSTSCTTNAFTMVSGGGVDYKLNKLISIRPAQVEYFSQRISIGALEGGNAEGIMINGDGFRYSAGAVIHF